MRLPLPEFQTHIKALPEKLTTNHLVWKEQNKTVLISRYYITLCGNSQEYIPPNFFKAI